MNNSDDTFDVLVIGSGFGGLGAALSLVEAGARVLVCETLKYPGGCASTFSRGVWNDEREGSIEASKGRTPYRFEAGATLFSGFDDEQLFGRWIRKHRLDVTIDWIDPLVQLRTPALHLAIGRDRKTLVPALAALPGAPEKNLRAFFERQTKVANTLWSLFDDPALLPPLSMVALGKHLLRSPKYATLLPLLGKSLGSVLASMGLDTFEPLRHYLDCLCQITVQCDAASAEAPFALATMDYYFRGTAHVRGGIGELASALAKAIEALGGQVRFSTQVKALHRDGQLWRVQTRKGEVFARSIVANVLPQNLRSLLGVNVGELPRLDRLANDVDAGWGAVMLYLVARAPENAPKKPLHLELVGDGSQPFTEGNHVFVSISGPDDLARCPPGHRTLTCSTHVPLASLRNRSSTEQEQFIAGIQARMREVLALRAPEWWENVTFSMTASPRTFERFTGRSGGAVGGIPRRAGLTHYLSAWPQPVVPGVWMVGDSVFPGQSTLATAIGGTRVAQAIRQM